MSTTRPVSVNQGPAPSVRAVLLLLTRLAARAAPDPAAPDGLRVRIRPERLGQLSDDERVTLWAGLAWHRRELASRMKSAVLADAFPQLPPGAFTPAWRPILALLADVAAEIPDVERDRLPPQGMARLLALECLAVNKSSVVAAPDSAPPAGIDGHPETGYQTSALSEVA